MPPRIKMVIGNGSASRNPINPYLNGNADVSNYINTSTVMPMGTMRLNSSMIDRIARTKSGCGSCGK